MSEFALNSSKYPKLAHFLKAEQYATEWASEASRLGWPFDVKKAKTLMNTLDGDLDNAYAKLSHILGGKAVCPDKKYGLYPSKDPIWTKAGFYDATMAKWFEINPCSGYTGEERMVEGPYCRVKFEALSLDSTTDVKIFLFRNGWVPTEYNQKYDQATRSWIQMSPKITEDSLELLGGDGALYSAFLSSKSRHGVLTTWLSNVDEDENLHGECIMVGTPSMRARHKIIANIPSADAPYGPEMRTLFKASPGWTLVGADSKGNQARGLAHYLGNANFIELLLNGDVHQYNADILTHVLKEMGIEHTVPRGIAKRILYAFLFGASGAKLWSYVFGNMDPLNGNKLKNGFLKAVPGFKDLLDRLKKAYSKTGGQNGFGYIRSIAGNKIYVDSFHKLLVYLLQACEKVTCSTALMVFVDEMRKRKIPYRPLIYYHDEFNFMVPDEHAEEARYISEAAFKVGPEVYGIKIMGGAAKIGPTWLEIH